MSIRHTAALAEVKLGTLIALLFNLNPKKKCRRIPFIWINWEGEPSGYA